MFVGQPFEFVHRRRVGKRGLIETAHGSMMNAQVIVSRRQTLAKLPGRGMIAGKIHQQVAGQRRIASAFRKPADGVQHRSAIE